MKVRWKDEVRDVGAPEATDAAIARDTRSALTDGRVSICWRGRTWDFSSAEDGRGGLARRRVETLGGLLSPMPGRVRQVLVGEGDRVAKGQVLLVLEAMKMEHAIRAPHDGTVAKLAYGEGDLVDAGAVLAEVTPD